MFHYLVRAGRPKGRFRATLSLRARTLLCFPSIPPPQLKPLPVPKNPFFLNSPIFSCKIVIGFTAFWALPITTPTTSSGGKRQSCRTPSKQSICELSCRGGEREISHVRLYYGEIVLFFPERERKRKTTRGAATGRCLLSPSFGSGFFAYPQPHVIDTKLGQM